MISTFEGESADDVWRLAAAALLGDRSTLNSSSRIGMTSELLHCVFCINDPRARWVLSRLPAMNPAFAIVESLWILAGRRDSALPNYWNPALPRYSGDATSYHGAYGYRLRHQFRFDQLERAYQALAANPESRQVVLQIWDPAADFPGNDGSPVAPDVPCNICSVLKVREGCLEWLQLMRSNDLFRGLPHNFVQFTILQEVMAGWLGLELGHYVHISDSLHLYHSDRDVLMVEEDRSGLAGAGTQSSLYLPKERFAGVLESMVQGLDRLAAEDLSRKELRRICGQSRPPSYRDLILICAADSARRRGWLEEQDWAVTECGTPHLRLAFARWATRSAKGVRT